MKDYYKVLGATPLDSRTKIQEIYRNQSRRFKERTEKDMKLILEAFNTLNDDDKRKEYDAQSQFQIKKNSPGLTAAVPKKKSEGKKPFRWGIPLMEIIMMPFKGDLEEKKEESSEEKAQVHFTQGVLMAEDSKMLNQAVKEFQETLQLVPGVREAQYNMGIVYYRAGKYREALSCFQKCVEMESRDHLAKKMVELLSD